MSESIPSQNEDTLCRCKALYLGTTIFNPSSKKVSESNLNLSQLQDSISERYPTNGDHFTRGIQTWLTVYPSGIQMEHSSKKDLSAINALFYYPIKSIVYCGALRFVNYFDTRDREPRSWKFVPIDTEIAQLNDNQKNPPLFVVFLKGIDPSSKKQIIECHVFIVGAIKTAMKLVECCQKAFSLSKESVLDFYKKFGNVPVVYCMKNQLKDRDDKRIVVKIYDTNGYFYAVENTPIEIWELFEKSEVFYESISKGKGFNPYSRSNCVQKECDQIYSDLMPNQDEQAGVSCKNREELNEKKLIIDPYEKSENLVKVEKRVDPITGQNIYVRYLADTNTAKTNTTKTYDIPTQLYDNEIESDIEIEIDEAEKCKKKQPPIIIRQEKTPSPIIVEKYIKKKAPQVIIKEIHVHEPAPPPVKIVQTMDNQYSDGNMEEQDVPIYGMRNPVPFPRAGPVPIPRIGPRPGVMIRPMPVPYSGPQIRMSNPNNPRPLISNNPALYTSPKSLLNQVYGTSRLPPPIEYRHTTDNLYSREPFPFYSNRPIPMNNYKKFNTDIGLGPITPGRSYNKNDGLYDFGEIKPRFVNYEPTIGIGHRNYSSLKNINSRPPVHYNRYDEYGGSNVINDKYSNLKPSNQKSVYTDQAHIYKTSIDSSRRAYDYEYSNRLPKNYNRDSSTGRIETRKSYRNY